MHSKISVAVPSRHRWPCLNGFLESFLATTKESGRPVLTVLHDSPESYDDSMRICDKNSSLYLRSLWLPEKSGLAELWNWSVMTAPTEWVLICNDDITFNPGWVEYLDEMINSGKYILIHLFHYGAMCLSKQFILEHGWFDERFHFAGYEDNDSQLRISEANLKQYIDKSHDFIRKENNVEIGHYVNHLKYVYNAPGWIGGSNEPWFIKKWKTQDGVNFTRMAPEIDWHPKYTMKYSARYNLYPKWLDIANFSVLHKKQVTH